MAGLNSEGFTPLSYEEVRTRIQSKLEAFNIGFDFSPESPDGQLVDIFAFELSQAWSEISQVYNSFDPNNATGAALKNIGLITGTPYGAATRSQVTVQLIGTLGTKVPYGSIITDADGNEFTTEFDAIIPASVPAIATVAGPIEVPIGTVTVIGTTITGWDSVTQTSAGSTGATAQTDVQYRNKRNTTVLRNYTGIADVIQARLYELGVEQVTVVNNDTDIPFADGTPAKSIHVTIGDVVGVSDADIANVILNTKSLGCPTYGSTTVAVDDNQGNSHDINFTKAVPVEIFVDMDITYLDVESSANAEEDIKDAIVADINSQLAGDDVIWSRMFSLITPYGKAQVNTLTIGRSLGTLDVLNIPLTLTEYSTTSIGNINITTT